MAAGARASRSAAQGALRGLRELVSGEGDSFFVVFLDARQAIQCAAAIQESLTGDPIPITGVGEQLPRRVQVKIGIHTGAATQIERGGRPNYDDHTINIAHRIQEQAAPDQVLTSRDAWSDAGEIEGLRSAERASYKLKGVQEAWALVEVLWGGREPQAPPPRVAATEPPDQALNISGDMVLLKDRSFGGSFLIAAGLEFVNRTQLPRSLDFRLRVRMRDNTWEAFRPVPVPAEIIGATPEVSFARGQLQFPLRLAAGDADGGYAAFFMVEPIWNRFAPGGLDVLNPDNLAFELRDIATNEVSAYAVNRQWWQWRLIRRSI